MQLQKPRKISQQPTQQLLKISQQPPQQPPQQALQQEDWLCGWIWLLLSTSQLVFAGGLHEEETGTPYEKVGGASEGVGGAYKEGESNAFGVLDLVFFATSAVLLLWTGEGIWTTQLGGGELTTDSCCWIVSFGVVDGLGVQLTLGSSLVGLLARGFTFDAWGFSTLEEDAEEELLLQVAVTLGPLVDILEVGDNGGAGGFEAWPKSF